MKTTQAMERKMKTAQAMDRRIELKHRRLKLSSPAGAAAVVPTAFIARMSNKTVQVEKCKAELGPVSLRGGVHC